MENWIRNVIFIVVITCIVFYFVVGPVALWNLIETNMDTLVPLLFPLIGGLIFIRVAKIGIEKQGINLQGKTLSQKVQIFTEYLEKLNKTKK